MYVIAFLPIQHAILNNGFHILPFDNLQLSGILLSTFCTL